jgi:hypothetical protein
MVFAATQAANINHNRDNQYDQIGARDSLMCVRHPRIGQGRQREKKETEQRQQQPVVSPLQIIGK